MKKICKLILLICTLHGIHLDICAHSNKNQKLHSYMDWCFRNAILSGNIEYIESYPPERVNVNWSYSIGGQAIPALVEAVRCGNPNIVKLLLDKGACVNSCTMFHGSIRYCKDCPAFIEAVMLPGKSEEERASRYEIVQLFLDNGVDIDVKDKDGNTGLMHSVRNCEDNMVEFLLNKGANKDIDGSMYAKKFHTPHKYAHLLKARYEKDMTYSLEHQKHPDRVLSIHKQIEKINRIITLFDTHNNTK